MANEKRFIDAFPLMQNGWHHLDKIGNEGIDTDRCWGRLGKWVRYGDGVTHWMPLPEPPKGDQT